MSGLVDEVIEHEFFVEIDTDELCWGSLHDVLDSFCEARLDLNVHFHGNCLSGLWVDLQTPDENLGLIGGTANQELIGIAGLITDDHWRGVDEAEDLGNALLRAGMRIEDLFECRFFLVRVDVPDLKLTVESTNK